MDPNDKDIQDASIKEYWKKKHTDENYQHFSISPIFQKYFSLLLENSSGYILDHGCGGGRLSLAIAMKRRKVALCDISSAAVNKSISLLQKNNLQDFIIWSHVGQIEEWNGLKKWGCVCSHRVLHAIPQKSRANTLHQLALGLQTSGKLLLTAKSVNCPRFNLLKSDRSFQSIEDDSQTFLRKEPYRYIHYFTEIELRRILESNNLSIIDYTEFDETTGNLLRGEDTALNKYWLFYCEKNPT